MYLVLEIVCVLLIAVGLALWVAVGAGVFAAGALGLVLVIAAQMPTSPDGGG